MGPARREINEVLAPSLPPAPIRPLRASTQVALIEKEVTLWLIMESSKPLSSPVQAALGGSRGSWGCWVCWRSTVWSLGAVDPSSGLAEVYCGSPVPQLITSGGGRMVRQRP